MKLGVVGLGLIGASMALGLRERFEVHGYDISAESREAAGRRGIRTVAALRDLLPADVVIVATPLQAIVPTLEALVPIAGDALLIEVGSLKSPVAAFAERAPASARIVGLHPMAGSTVTGTQAADPAMFRGRPFVVVPTARTDERAIASATSIAHLLGGHAAVVSPDVHDRAVAAVSALPLATAMALAPVARSGSPIDLASVAGPGLHDTTRLAATSPELALALLAAPGLREHLVALRAAIAEIESALGDDAALRALLDRAAEARPS